MKRSISEVDSDSDEKGSKRRKLDESTDLTLPKEIWLQIIASKNIMLNNSIDFMNILTFREVNTYFKQIIDEDPDLPWALKYFKHFGGFNDDIKYSTKTWKQIYLNARAALKKLFEDELEEKTDLPCDDLTLHKVDDDFNEIFGEIWNAIDADDELQDKLAGFVCERKHCSLVDAYLDSGVHHMEVFHMLFDEKYYKTWSKYNEEANFDQMDVQGLLFEDQLGTAGHFNIENIPRVLDMTVRGGMEADLYGYWRHHGEALQAQLLAQGRTDLVAQIAALTSEQ